MGYQSIFRADAFDDKVIIVTGGGSGIGRCTAHELASLGAQVVITGRKIEERGALEMGRCLTRLGKSLQVCNTQHSSLNNL